MATETRITAPNGRYSIITSREQEARFGDRINHLSSLIPQPWICGNFDDHDQCVGGRTMTEAARVSTLAKAKAAGCVIT